MVHGHSADHMLTTSTTHVAASGDELSRPDPSTEDAITLAMLSAPA